MEPSAAIDHDRPVHALVASFAGSTPTISWPSRDELLRAQLRRAAVLYCCHLPVSRRAGPWPIGRSTRADETTKLTSTRGAGSCSRVAFFGVRWTNYCCGPRRSPDRGGGRGALEPAELQGAEHPGEKARRRAFPAAAERPLSPPASGKRRSILGIGIGGNATVSSAARASSALSSYFCAGGVSASASAPVGAVSTPEVMTLGSRPRCRDRSRRAAMENSAAALVRGRGKDQFRRTRRRHRSAGKRGGDVEVGRPPRRQRPERLGPESAAGLDGRSVAGDVGLLQRRDHFRLDRGLRRRLGGAGVGRTGRQVALGRGDRVRPGDREPAIWRRARVRRARRRRGRSAGCASPLRPLPGPRLRPGPAARRPAPPPPRPPRALPVVVASCPPSSSASSAPPPRAPNSQEKMPNPPPATCTWPPRASISARACS